MSVVDWAIVVVYGATIIGIGALASRRQNDTDSFFRGGRRLPWWALGISIIATAFSAASLLGGPGEGYGHGFLWLQLQLGDLIGYALVCVLFIPVLVRLDVTTAYEFLERRFDVKTRTLGAMLFSLFVIVRLGALLYGAALVFAEVSGVSLGTAILLVGIVSIVYTVVGGITAVVWTDVVQFAMILVGVAACIAVAASGVQGGMPVILDMAREGGRLRWVDATWDPSSIRTLPTALIAYGMLAFAVAGTNQQSVQRYVSCASARDAQKAALLGWFTGFVGVAATLLLGVVFYGYYALRPGLLPDDTAPDQILPTFIAHELPVGVAGLLVAAVFAAAMSSIDSALHSLSTTMVVDFYRRLVRPRGSEAHYLRVAQGMILFWGIVGIGAAFYVAQTGESLLPFLAKYTSYFIGPVLGMFLLAVLVPFSSGHGAFFGALLSVAGLVGMVQATSWSIPGIWYAAITAPSTVVLGMALSLRRPQRRPAAEP